MTHLRHISRNTPPLAQQGRITLEEQVILTLLSLFFSDWDNFPIVIQNLRKFYSKTP